MIRNSGYSLYTLTRELAIKTAAKYSARHSIPQAQYKLIVRKTKTTCASHKVNEHFVMHAVIEDAMIIDRLCIKSLHGGDKEMSS